MNKTEQSPISEKQVRQRFAYCPKKSRTKHVNEGKLKTMQGEIRFHFGYLTVKGKGCDVLLDQAKRLFGDVDDWAKLTKPEAAKHKASADYVLEQNGVLIIVDSGGDEVQVRCRQEAINFLMDRYSIDSENDWVRFIDPVEAVGFTTIRTDWTFDEYCDLTPFDKLESFCHKRNEYARRQETETRLLFHGEAKSTSNDTVYIGAWTSDFMVRVYDKRQDSTGEEFCRWEIETTGDVECPTAWTHFRTDGSNGILAFLRERLRFREPSKTDSNEGRWPDQEWWAALTAGGRNVVLSRPDKVYKNPGEKSFLHWPTCKRTVAMLVAERGWAWIMDEIDKVHLWPVQLRYLAKQKERNDESGAYLS